MPVKTTASAATVPLLPALERELRAHRSRQASATCGSPTGTRSCSPQPGASPSHAATPSVRFSMQATKSASTATGAQPVGLHDLRHSFVAIALANSVTLPEAAMLARHANPRVTLAVYAG